MNKTHIDTRKKIKNTLGLCTNVLNLIAVRSELDLQQIAEKQPLKETLVVGKASNLMFHKNWYGGTVLVSQINEIKKIDDNLFFIGSGVLWDDFVEWAVNKGEKKIAFLSAIPGSVGGAIVQNIGAYGVEISSLIESVRFWDCEDSCFKEFSAKECKFDYRDSVFKSKKTMITGGFFRLGKVLDDLPSYAGLNCTKNDSAKTIRKKVIEVRSLKLPDIKKHPNCGSFFKNPVVSNIESYALQKKYPEMPVFKLNASSHKLSAAWLIEKSGLKGFCIGEACVSEKHSLVIVNKGGATSSDVLQLKDKIQQEVQKKYGVFLEPEVTIVKS